MNDSAPVPGRVRIRGDGYTAEAGWFGPEDRPRFGWLYRPDAPTASGTGIVIVPPFGFEAICAHRSLRRLAEDAARAGLIALRFDLDGTGDSAGDDTDPQRVEGWIASIHDACDLVRAAGAGQLALVGARLGATLAALAAPQRNDVTALVAINAVVRGRDFLREARALQATMGLRPSPSPQPDDGSQEVNGFVIGAETRARIGAIDLAKEPSPGVRTALLIERDDMPERNAWPDRLRGDGIDTTVQRLPGLREMFDVPHMARVPESVLGACIEFACALPNANTPDAVPVAALRSEARMRIDGTDVIERAAWIDGALFAIETFPATAADTRGILLLNAGAVAHIGSNRLYVDWARRWASSGTRVLRADLSGLGDSATRAGAADNLVYGPNGIGDAVALAGWMREHGTRHVTLGGACSGAYHALRAALTERHVDAIFLINPGALRDIGVVSNLATAQNDNSYYTNQLRNGSAWRKLTSGKASPRKIARVAGWYASTYGSAAAREAARRLHLPLRGDLGTELQSLANRDVGLHFVFSADDPSRALLATDAGSVARRLRKSGQLVVTVIDGPDHTFTPRWSHGLLLDALQRFEAATGCP